ncbi:MBL fold metallo-hydrolase [Streptomyces sp. NPDC051018]|uniref:MBL fold metallo-hydrolase n=1 Tax=Streptomyces sp. NPDC051018 TaxID=3365639 RepID=UPI0037A9F4A6
MSIEITGREQWQAWQDGVLPPVERVADGLWSIPVPIPDNPLRYVLVYALEAADGLVLVDAGWDAEESWLALTRGITSFGYSVAEVRTVLVTHYHGDHFGLAGRIREASDARVAMHSLDAAELKSIPDSVELWAGAIGDHLRRHGAPEGMARSAAGGLELERHLRPPMPDLLLEDGMTIPAGGRELRAVWTPGHTPGHTCFYEEGQRLLFSGDHVLPRITPQIAVVRQGQGDPLSDFLLSLERLDRLSVDEVLPAHEYRFRGLSRRVAVMAEHHAQRLKELHSLLGDGPGVTAWTLAGQLSWSRPWDSFSPTNRRFALAETLAHFRLLEMRGEAHRAEGAPVSWSLAAA